jgi:hypothetical protein
MKARFVRKEGSYALVVITSPEGLELLKMIDSKLVPEGTKYDEIFEIMYVAR